MVKECGGKMRILLVEDNPVNLKLGKHLLTSSGCLVTAVTNGKIALDTFSANPGDFDLIFMDVHMPVMDGKEATKIIRSHGFNIPIIAMTAQTMKGDREKFLDIGMNDFIAKPIKRNEFHEKLEKWTKVVSQERNC